jgi:hypothetical protein
MALHIQQRLQELSELDPYLSETQAKDEFLSALTKIEKRQSVTRNHQLGKNWILLIIPIYAKVSFKGASGSF